MKRFCTSVLLWHQLASGGFHTASWSIGIGVKRTGKIKAGTGISGSSGSGARSQEGCLVTWSDQDIILLQGDVDGTRFIFDVQASLFMSGLEL